VAVSVFDRTTAMITYQEDSSVVLRPVPLTWPGTMTENPPGMTMFALGATESAFGLASGNGLSMTDPRYPGGAIGRAVVAAAIQGGGGGPGSIRVRAIEACVHP